MGFPAKTGGTVVTLATPDQAGEVRTLAKQAGIRPTTVTVRPGDAQITALTGPPAEYVEPAPVVEQAPQQRSRGPRQAQGQPQARSGQPQARSGQPKARSSSPRAAAKAAAGPARTRAELAARAGQPAAARRPRSR